MGKIFFKSVLYLFILCGGIYTSENISPFFDGTMAPPSQAEFYVIEKVLETAKKHSSLQFFPNQLSDCEFEFDLAKKAVYSELIQPKFFRDFTYSSKKINTAQDKAIDLLLKTAKKEREVQNKIQDNFVRLENMLTKAKSLFEHTSNNIVARQRYARAEIFYKSARELFKSKQFSSALKESSKALEMAEKAYQTSKEILSRYSDPKLIEKWISLKKRAIEESKSVGSAIVVNKEKHTLELYRKGSILRTFHAELGANSTSPKLYAGDRATPEGYYHITTKKAKGKSTYYMALLINYPNNEDKQRFNALKSKKELGSKSSIGGLIEIHGGGGKGFDWTDGCVAVTDNEMEYIFKQVSVGTPVAIIGSDGNGPINNTLMDIK